MDGETGLDDGRGRYHMHGLARVLSECPSSTVHICVSFMYSVKGHPGFGMGYVYRGGLETGDKALARLDVYR